jgi:hypothetical protein
MPDKVDVTIAIENYRMELAEYFRKYPFVFTLMVLLPIPGIFLFIKWNKKKRALDQKRIEIVYNYSSGRLPCIKKTFELCKTILIMTIEEIKKRIVEFENMMGRFHRDNSTYLRRNWEIQLSLISMFRNAFGKNKQKIVYEQLLEDIKLIYHDIPHDEYLALRNRVITAFET